MATRPGGIATRVALWAPKPSNFRRPNRPLRGALRLEVSKSLCFARFSGRRGRGGPIGKNQWMRKPSRRPENLAKHRDLDTSRRRAPRRGRFGRRKFDGFGAQSATLVAIPPGLVAKPYFLPGSAPPPLRAGNFCPGGVSPETGPRFGRHPSRTEIAGAQRGRRAAR